MAYVLDVIFADGTSARYPLQAEETTVGSAASAGVQIDEPALEAEHVLLAPQSDGCWVGVAQSARSPVYVSGSVFSQGIVPWGTSLSVGPITLKLSAEESSRDKPSAVSLPVLLMALIGMPLGLWLMMSGPAAFQLPQRSAKAPELFASKLTCPKSGEPSGLGKELSSAAVAKAERYAFDPADGIEAVELYRQAAACLEKAGERPLAAKITSAAEALEQTVGEDYKTHRVRLKRA
ncbi:MAG: FHA domain-containing protein, partial [Deltaproteobacteria bacterium]|nr:FHA domain-containing protein [Deltaproteobacteria bacterium]